MKKVVAFMALLGSLTACDSAPASKGPSLTGDALKNSVRENLHRIILAANVCDTAGQAASKYLGSGDIQNAYEFSKSAEASCSDTSRQIEQVGVPDGLGSDQAKAFSDAESTIGLAYFAKSEAFGKISTALDGGIKPSIIADIKEQNGFFQGELLKGIEQYYSAAEAVGVKAGEFSQEKFAGQVES